MIFPRNRGDFPQRLWVFSSAIAGIFPAIPGGIFPRYSKDFPSEFRGFFPDKMTNLLTVMESSCYETDASTYSGLPRRQDDVLDPLRPPQACRMQRSFVLLMDTKIWRVPLCWSQLDWLELLARGARAC